MGTVGDCGSPVGSHQGVFTALCLRRQLRLQGRGLGREVWELSLRAGMVTPTGRDFCRAWGSPWWPRVWLGKTAVHAGTSPRGTGLHAPQMTAVGGGAGVPSGPELRQRTQDPGRLQDGVAGRRHAGCGVSQVQGLLQGVWEVPRGICWPLAGELPARSEEP